MERSNVVGRIPQIAFVCLMVGLMLGLIFPEAVLAEGPYFATKEEAVSHVPTHVVPKDCFVWKDGPDATPWRVIPGTGCAHWVAHELGLGIFPSPWQRWEMGEIEPPLPPEAWQVCYDGFYIRVADIIAGRTEVEIKDAKVGDIWTTSGLSHSGIVRQVKDDKVLVEHDSSAAGGVIQTWFDSGRCWHAHKLDLIFAIDVTGSMWDDIAAVKASASEVVEAIHSKVTGCRIAVVSYRDFPVWPYGNSGDWPYKDVLGFSGDKTAIIAAIQSLNVGGGADWRESVYSALMHCIDSSSLGGWRTGADKFIILMGDAPPHDPEPFTGYTLSTVATAAEEADPVSIYPIAIGPDFTTYTYFSWLAEATEGKVFTAETASEVPEAIIEAIEEIIDNIPPEINVVTPAPTSPPQALQDGVTLEATVTDPSGVDWVTFSIRELNGDQGIVIDPMFESMPATNTIDDQWTLNFDTTQLPDGYYLLLVEASDTLGNEGYVTVEFSIRNWAVVELLPASENNKARRTMPVKFSLRVAEAVDPAKPFVYNEELTIIVRRKDTGEVLQTSTYGDTSTDYRINPVNELYITNFKTLKTPLTYVVEVYRKDMLLDSFEFSTVK